MAAPEEYERNMPFLSGVPLGGVGAGYVEFCPDGRFRNIAINNNRTPHTRIPLSKHSFLALRLRSESGWRYERILRHALPDEPQASHPVPPSLEAQQTEWRGLYPTAQLSLVDPHCPVRVLWGAFSPIIPFDHDASALPAIFVSLHCSNPTQDSIEASVLFNWENLCGFTRQRVPGKLPQIAMATIEENPAPTIPGIEPHGDQQGLDLPNALVFSSQGGIADNADGQYCVVVRPQDDAEVSLVAWDPEDEESCRAFWSGFTERGDVGGLFLGDTLPRAGAVCTTFTLPPGRSHRADFMLSWYCPRFVVGEQDLSNAYTNRFGNAIDVAQNNLRHYKYYFTSIEDWHKRLLSSSLPAWLGRLLINSTAVFSTNTVYTKNGNFAMREDPLDTAAGRLETRLYRSLGTLLFFPRFEENELALHMESKEDDRGCTVIPVLRRMSAAEGVRDHWGGSQVLLGAQLVLSAYRNFLLTGNLAPMQSLYPKLRSVVRGLVKSAEDGDGLPSPDGVHTTWDGLDVTGLDSPTASLWIAALKAFAKLADRLQDSEEKMACEEQAARAAEAFEKHFWDEERGHYRFFIPQADEHGGATNAALCHTGQLAGQWVADLLGLGRVVRRERIGRSLETLSRMNQGEKGFFRAVHADGSPCRHRSLAGTEQDLELLWPSYLAADYACLELRHGNPQRALAPLEQYLGSAHARMGRICGLPDRLPVVGDGPLDPNREPHASGLAIWHLLYAMTGFHMYAAHRRIRVAPMLPESKGKCRLPLFTPACLGWLDYHEHTGEPYRQELHMTFDSPVSVEEIELRVPETVDEVEVACATNEYEIVTSHALAPTREGKRLTIKFRSLAAASQMLRVEVTGREEAAQERPPSLISRLFRRES